MRSSNNKSISRSGRSRSRFLGSRNLSRVSTPRLTYSYSKMDSTQKRVEETWLNNSRSTSQTDSSTCAWKNGKMNRNRIGKLTELKVWIFFLWLWFASLLLKFFAYCCVVVRPFRITVRNVARFWAWELQIAWLNHDFGSSVILIRMPFGSWRMIEEEDWEWRRFYAEWVESRVKRECFSFYENAMWWCFYRNS